MLLLQSRRHSYRILVVDLNIIFDMETHDPDDFITLLLLLGHPQVNLKAVTITPGSPYQVGLVKMALKWFKTDLPIGAYNIDHPEKCVSSWHEKSYGNITPTKKAEPGWKVLSRYCNSDTTLVTGAPLRNLGRAMDVPGFHLGRLVAQGGFAGTGVVPWENQLEKFKGLRTCPSFNLNGDPKSALRAIAFDRIGKRLFVSKNVCHGVIYDEELHGKVKTLKHENLALELIWQGMEVFLENKYGKKLHDPLAACCAIDPLIGEWAEVELFREKGDWGSKLSKYQDLDNNRI